MAPRKAVYLFCLSKAELLPARLEGTGLDEASSLRKHQNGEIAAVVSDVSLDDFTGAAGEAHLKDLAWLTPRVLRHEQVIEQVGRSSPVFPARFGTIFSSLDALDGVLEKHHDSVRAFLDRTAETEEWGLKGFLDKSKAREKIVDSELASRTAQLSKSPGLRYMQERRIRAEAETQLRHWLDETASHLRDDLSNYAVESTERRLLASTSEKAGEMVFNLAFLLPRAAVGSFRLEGEKLSRELSDWGLSLELAGPFPPYSFTPGISEQQR